MDREKMIEEMFDDLVMAFIKKMTRVGIDKKEVAKELIKMGYRKVPEGAVVLTREDLQKYAKDCLIGEVDGYDILQMAFARANRWREDARKETAREIVQKLKGFRFVMYDEFDDGHEVASWTCDEDDVKRFAKEIGAE